MMNLCDSPGKNTGVGHHFLLQGFFPTQRSNPHLLCLLHWQMDSLPLVPPGKPLIHTTMYKTVDSEGYMLAKSLQSRPTLATLWIIDCQAALSMGFSSKNHHLLQGIFPTQGSNPCLLYGFIYTYKNQFAVHLKVT